MLDPAEGEVFNRGNFDESISKLQQAYLDKGYLLSEVVPIPTFDETDSLVNITLKINEGDVIIIGKVMISGLEKTMEHVVKRELDFLDIETDELLDIKSLRKAPATSVPDGIFHSCCRFCAKRHRRRKPKRSEGSNIAETPRTGMLSLGGGYGSEGGIFGNSRGRTKQSARTCLQGTS